MTSPARWPLPLAAPLELPQWAWWLRGAPVQIIGVLVTALAARWLLHRAIRGIVAAATDRQDRHDDDRPTLTARAGRVLSSATGLAAERRRQRALTMGSILRSVATVTVVTLTALTVLAILGVPLAPLLASAGVGGVALGFGAQSLVKDFLSGIFMIVEDQYGVGDVIDTGEAVGTVEEVSLRVTRVRDADGVVWYIRNGEITRIGNKSQGWQQATIDVPVSYAESPERVVAVIRQVTEAAAESEDLEAALLEPPTVAGVESVSGGVMTVRVFAKCEPGEQFAVSRALRERIKTGLDAAGIAGPPLAPPGP